MKALIAFACTLSSGILLGLAISILIHLKFSAIWAAALGLIVAVGAMSMAIIYTKIVGFP